MTNSKSTKRALMSSILAMLVCVAMLIGSTFAWFTDSVTSGRNQIVAGNLDVELYHGDDLTDKVDGATNLFTQEDGTAIQWEPGVIAYENFKVENVGSLALKYQLTMNIAGYNTVKDTELSLVDVLKVAILDESFSGDRTAAQALTFDSTLSDFVKNGVLLSGASDTYAVVIYWEPGANDNDYNLNNGKESSDGEPLYVDLGVTLAATQTPYEEDSFGNDYDEGIVIANSGDAASFAAALNGIDAAGDKSVIVNVTQDIGNITGIKTGSGNNLTVDFGENTVTVDTTVGSSGTETNGMQLLKGSTVTLQNGTYAAANDNVKILIQNYSDLTLEDLTLDGTTSENCICVLSTNHGNVVIKGDTNIIARNGQIALDVMHWENASYQEGGTHVVIDETMTGTVDGRIDVYCYGSTGARPVDDGGATLTIMGGTYINTGLTLEQFSAYVPEGYKVTDFNGKYVVTANDVTPAADGASLQAAIDAGEKVLLTENISASFTDTASSSTGTEKVVKIEDGTAIDLGHNTISIQSQSGYNGIYLEGTRTNYDVTAKLSNGTIIKDKSAGSSGATVVASRSTLILENMTITAETGTVAEGPYAVRAEGYQNTKIILRNCTVSGNVMVGSGAVLEAENTTIKGVLNVVNGGTAILDNSTYNSKSGSGTVTEK